MELYKNPACPVEERVKDLLSRMTLDEKFVQLSSVFDYESMLKGIDDGTFPENGFGATYISSAVPREELRRLIRYQIEHTRLGIPLLIAGESIHGLMYNGATVFPIPLALGASFSPELVSEMADVIGAEAEAVGVRQTYAPNLDITRDPRWGRAEENYGEDPYLTSRMGVAYIKAFQSHHAASTPKHYLAHGTPEGGINAAPTSVGERLVREVMLEAFAAAVKEGKCLSLMPAYSELDGIPMHASSYWLRDVLRDELGFDGYVCSDSGAIMEMDMLHHTAGSPEEAGRRALFAGVNQELPKPYGFDEGLKQAVAAGEVPISLVDEAVSNVLRVKFKLGLFEQPYPLPDSVKIHEDKSVALARRIAQETTVLLKNNGVLPLSDKIGKIAVVGPNAGYPRLGGYTPKGPEAYSVSLLDALKARLGADRVSYAKGCNVVTEGDLDAAVRAAEGADAVIVSLGDNSSCWFGQGWGDDEGGNFITCGEGKDSATLQLPAVQKNLLRAMKQTGKPIVLILETGRPYVISEECELSDAVMEAWFGGEQGGNALADLLFGDVNPSGKLPISFPKSVGHVPCFYNCKPTARGAYQNPDDPEETVDKLQVNPAALFPFGYGLSYTTFAYTDLSYSDGKVSVTVTNTGSRTGKETVLMFITHKVCPVTPFVKRLRGFTKIELKPGESRTVSFTIKDEDVSYIDERMKTAVGQGPFTVTVGDQSLDFTRS